MRRLSPSSLVAVALVVACSLPLTNAIPSSTNPNVDPSSSQSFHYRTKVLSNVRTSLKEIIHDWFHHSPLHETITITYPDSTDTSSHLFAQYGDQLVLRFNVSTEHEVASLAEAADILFLDIWESSDNWVDIRVAGDVLPSLLGLLPPSMQHSHTPLMTGLDLARAIADTYPSPSSQIDKCSPPHRAYRGFTPNSRTTRGPSTDVFFDDYRSLHVITHWMQLLESIYTTHVKMISVGKSSEGRDIWALKAGVKPNNAQTPSSPRKTIVVSAGSHAREWISTSTVNYIAHALISQYGRNSHITKLLEDFDWILIPTLNPDGYVYSWDNDRLWRKSRQPTTLRFCRGLDLDRSYGFKWDGQRTADNPCSESFAGLSAFEATESKSFSEWAKNETVSNNVDFVGLLDLHSYSEQILYPYSFSCRETPPNMEDLAELGQGLAKAIRTGTHEFYKVIPACGGNVAVSGNTLSKMEGSGGSLLDWFYHEMGAKHAFQIKLRDKGSYGFLLPRGFIVPTGVEALSAVDYFGKSLAAIFYSSRDGADFASGGEQTQRVLE